MPRTARSIRAGICYHVLNRGNARATVFHDAMDYGDFTALAREATQRTPLDVFGYCLMPNHFHFVVRPYHDDGLAKWMHWLATTHAHRYRRRYAHVGHIWQGRFKAFPVKDDGHLLTVIRYVERNALRAGLVNSAEKWPWSSLSERLSGLASPLACQTPIALPTDWQGYVNTSDSAHELEAIRNSVTRGAPFGDADWTVRLASTLRLRHTLRPPGRPPKNDCHD